MKMRASMESKTYTMSASAKGGIKAEDIASALEAGARVLQSAVRRTISSKARSHPRNLLEKSISFTRPTNGPLYSKTNLGWERTKIKASTRNRENGSKRVVDTVDGYGRILEYSSRYQLRHMEPSAEENMDAALEAVESVLDEAIDKTLAESGL